MTLAVLYKYINCIVDNLMSLTLVTDSITNSMIIKDIWILVISFCCKSLKIDPFQGLI